MEGKSNAAIVVQKKKWDDVGLSHTEPSFYVTNYCSFLAGHSGRRPISSQLDQQPETEGGLRRTSEVLGMRMHRRQMYRVRPEDGPARSLGRARPVRRARFLPTPLKRWRSLSWSYLGKSATERNDRWPNYCQTQLLQKTDFSEVKAILEDIWGNLLKIFQHHP